MKLYRKLSNNFIQDLEDGRIYPSSQITPPINDTTPTIFYGRNILENKY